MPDAACRLAQLEERVAHMQKELCCLDEDVKASLKDILDTLHYMKREDAKRKGFVGGAMWVITGMVGIATWTFHKYFGT
jgi:hypothetical protein